MKQLVILFLFFVTLTEVHAQDTAYARSVMMKLGSNEFSGRGYIHSGIDSAAEFIENEFIRIGLKPLNEHYTQSFKVPVNNITRALLVLGSDTLAAGRDFIPDAHVKSLSGDFGVLQIGEKVRNSSGQQKKISKKAAGKVLVLRMNEAPDKDAKDWYKQMAYTNPWNAAGIILLDSAEFYYSVALYGDRRSWFMIRLHATQFQKAIEAKKASCAIESNFIAGYPVKNVAAYLQGQEYSDSFIVITAHYDHIGMLDEAIFPGGNDNASGIAMMLDLARHMKNNHYRPRYSMVFLALGSEETGLHGSRHFVEHPMFDLKKIRFLINLDMVGTGSTGITVVNATKFSEDFKRLVSLNDENHFIAGVKERGESCNSDHCPFYKKGVPAFFIYTTGSEYSEYHTIGDRPERVPLSAYQGLFSLLVSFMYSF